MADIISRLRLESGEFNAKLKRASQEMLAYERQCRKAGTQMSSANNDAKELARAIGSMQTVSQSAKGKVGELTTAFTDLRSQFNRLTADEKNSEFGRALSASLEQLKQRINQAKAELQDINRELDDTGTKEVKGGLFSGLGGKLGGAMQVFAGNVMTKLAGTVVGFSSEMADAVQQGIELAKQGEGIRIAFERLGRGDILDGLRQATHGTVSDLELMKAAVKFNDFKLPVEELGTMLAFAQQKAKDTGQSVDYMVDSIVTGLGRQSLMILDNLGLSASDVKERMKQTGDMTKAVGEIIREQMSKAGGYVETAADRATKANVELTNAMTRLGDTFQPLAEAGSSLWTKLKLGALDLLNSAIKPLINTLTYVGALRKEVENRGGNARIGADVKWIANSDDKERSYNNLLRGYMEEEMKALNALNEAKKGGRGSIGIYQKEYDAARKLREDFQAAAKPLLIPVDVDHKTVEDAVKKTKTAVKSAKIKTEDIFPEDSLRGLTRDLQELQKAQQLVTNNDDWRGYEDAIKAVQERIKELKGELSDIDAGNMTSLGKTQAVSIIDMAAGRVKGGRAALGIDDVPTRDDIIARGQARIRASKGVDVSMPTEERNGLEDTQKLVNGLSQVAGGLKQMGIELPEGVDKVLGGMQGLMSVIQGVNSIMQLFTTTTSTAQVTATTANTGMLTANSTALAALTSALYANMAVSAIPFFRGGGIVPHAALGYVVPGNDFSDRTPVMVSSGELILNQAQQGIVADAIEHGGNGQGGGMADMQPWVDGETIFLGMNNTSKRMGRGEIVTTSTLRRLGLIH